MNFKKKDNKRSSYYVWFLGAKESKGLRGDEYVTPVLSYLVDNAATYEPSKVTLQVSPKGLKIIQILTVPRKSAKLTADQQSQLFANCRRPSTAIVSNGDNSSMLKTEQVKHHISHDSITWVYQEEDIICAILLLYNPITRCPVHVHAYRCDSIETANNLRRQLQVVVDKPENQKKFREIETRLAAKGLLLPAGFPSDGDERFAEDDRGGFLPAGRQASSGPRYDRSPNNTSNKTFNSDGRSTRTEASDENSEESNSSADLGFSVRGNVSKTSDHLHRRHRHQPPSPPPTEIRYSKSHLSPTSPPLSSLPAMHAPIKSKSSYPNEPDFSKSKLKPSKIRPKADTEPELPPGVTVALYDSLAAELRAKLGNPKMGPLLLPPKDYDSSEEKARKKKAAAAAARKEEKATGCPLSRSESSGKSSSGIGSDEALSSETPQKKSFYNGRSSSSGGSGDNRIFGSNVDRKGVPDSRFLFGASSDRRGRETERQLFSLQPYSSDEDVEGEFEFSADDILDVDVEDFEENVNFTLTTPFHLAKSKSTVDLYYQQQQHQSSRPTSNSAFQQPQPKQRRAPSKPARTAAPPVASYLDRKAKGTEAVQMSKLYGSNPVLTRLPLTEYKSTEPKGLVVGRREQRSKHQQPATENYHRLGPPTSKELPSKFSNGQEKLSHSEHKSKSRPQQFFFADAEFGESRRNGGSRNYLGRSNGNLAAKDQYGPSSINVVVSADRSVSPYYYSHQAEGGYPLKSSSSKKQPPLPPPPNHSAKVLDPRFDQHAAMRRRQLEQPYSRYSYIDTEHHNYFNQ